MFPVAWAVVEGERKESWKWFLTELIEDLNHQSGQFLTLMSDQQKGLVPILNEFFAKVEHRMCARHIYANWHKKWKGANKKNSILELCKGNLC
ncbi:MUSTANG 7 [Hibiscus trionum]|uniref:MUSTANG 7 n=1 Tax=Hibiscus trionum TaxID=183268 RepID=A0A9W7GRH2_HIBTR|nr:MUSTANG 7 [Hibiscus trionum]